MANMGRNSSTRVCAKGRATEQRNPNGRRKQPERTIEVQGIKRPRSKTVRDCGHEGRMGKRGKPRQAGQEGSEVRPCVARFVFRNGSVLEYTKSGADERNHKAKDVRLAGGEAQ